MPAVKRILFTLCAALLLAGVGGLIAQGTGSSSPSRSGLPRGHPTPATGYGPGTTSSATTVAPVTTSTVPSEFSLQADLIVPNDLGGYYTQVPADSAPQLAGSGCLAALGHPTGAVHQAVQYLRGPYEGDLPIINEQISAFGGLGPASATYRSLASSLRACRAPTVSVSTGSAAVALTPLALQDLGDQATAAQGTYQLDRRTEQLTVAVVRAGGTIVVFEYADRVPASNPILGDVMSTIRATVGKATPTPGP